MGIGAMINCPRFVFFGFELVLSCRPGDAEGFADVLATGSGEVGFVDSASFFSGAEWTVGVWPQTMKALVDTRATASANLPIPVATVILCVMHCSPAIKIGS